jgi:hypothetical protein
MATRTGAANERFTGDFALATLFVVVERYAFNAMHDIDLVNWKCERNIVLQKSQFT